MAKIRVGQSDVAITADPHLESLLPDILEQFPPFKQFIAELGNEADFIVRGIHVQSVDKFGPKRIGFVKFKADVVNAAGQQLPGIVFMRGGAVGMLVIIRCRGTNKLYTVLTIQPRFPTGKYAFPEIPAGMLDGSGNFAGVAAQELKEEVGIVIREDKLIDLTALAYGDKFLGMYPSAGGCDEFLRLFAYRTEMEMATIQKLQGRLTGVFSEGETIKLKVIPFEDLWSCFRFLFSCRQEGST